MRSIRPIARIAMMALVLGLTAHALAQDRSSHQQPPQQQPPATQGFLGGRFVPMTEEMAKELGIEEQDGVVVIEIVERSPAEKAGLMEKDLLKKIDDKAIDDVESFRETMRTTKPGQTLKLTVLRDKQEKEISVTLGERPKNMPSTAPTTKPG